MRVAVIGTGGIGGVLAAHLTRAGMDVTPVVGNERVKDALATHGYRVEEFDGRRWSIPCARPPVLQLPEQERFDLALCVTQSTTLEAALTAALPRLHPSTIVVVCQNGLPEDRAAAVVGRQRVLGCVVGFGASMVEPGRFVRTSAGGLQIGRPFSTSPEPQSIATLLEAAAPVEIVQNLSGVRWSKLAINSVTTTLGAIGGRVLGRLLVHRAVRRLALEIFSEISAVAQAEGVTLTPVGGTLKIEKIAITQAERRLRLGSPSLAYKHSVLLAVGLKYRRLRSSMLYALERGRPPEIDFLNGEVVRRAEASDVSVPVNRALCEEVRRIASGTAVPNLESLKIIHDRVVTSRRFLTA